MPSELAPAKCRSCEAEIFWVKTAATGSLMPIERAAGGNLVVRDGRVVVTGMYDPALDGEATYVSHFSRCPEASRWRRKA